MNVSGLVVGFFYVCGFFVMRDINIRHVTMIN